MLRATKSATKIQKIDNVINHFRSQDIELAIGKVMKQQQWQFKRILSKCYLLQSKTQYLQQYTSKVTRKIRQNKLIQKKCANINAKFNQYIEQGANRKTIKKSYSVLSSQNNRKKMLTKMSVQQLIKQIIEDYHPQQILKIIKLLEAQLNSVFQRQIDQVMPLSVQESKFSHQEKKKIEQIKQKIQMKYSKETFQTFKKDLQKLEQNKNKEIYTLKKNLIQTERKLGQQRLLNEQLNKQHQQFVEKANQAEIHLRKQIMNIKKEQSNKHSRQDTQICDNRSEISSFVGRIIKRNVVVLSGKRLKDVLEQAENKIQAFIQKIESVNKKEKQVLQQQIQDLRSRLKNSELGSCDLTRLQSQQLQRSVISHESKKSLTNSNTARSNQKSAIQIKLKSKLNLCNKQLGAKQKQIEQLQQQLSEQFHTLSKKVLQAEAKCLYKEQQLNKNIAFSERQQKELEKLTERLKFIEQQLSKHEKLQLANKRDFEQKCKQKQNQYQNVINTYRNVLKQSEQRQQTLMNKLYTSRKNIETMQTQLNSKKEQIQKLITENSKLQLSNKNISQKLIRLQHQIQQGCQCHMNMSTKQTQKNDSSQNSAKKEEKDLSQKKMFFHFIDELKQKVTKLQSMNQMQAQKIVKMNRQLLKYKKEQLSKNLLNSDQIGCEDDNSDLSVELPIRKSLRSSQKEHMHKNYQQLLSKYRQLERQLQCQSQKHQKVIINSKRKQSELQLTIKELSRINNQKDIEKQAQIESYQDQITKLINQQVKLTKQISNLEMKLASSKNIFRNVLEIWESQVNLEEDLIDNLKLFEDIAKSKQIDDNFRKNHIRIYRRLKSN